MKYKREIFILVMAVFILPAFGCTSSNDDSSTEAGDLILYEGSAFVIYYAPNSWNFTRIGKINNITAEELKMVLGSGNVSVTLSLD